jgi:hypothetical protein
VHAAALLCIVPRSPPILGYKLAVHSIAIHRTGEIPTNPYIPACNASYIHSAWTPELEWCWACMFLCTYWRYGIRWYIIIMATATTKTVAGI